MDLHASDLTIRDGFNWPDAHLSILSHSRPEPDGFRPPIIVAQITAKLNLRRCYLRQIAEAQVLLARCVVIPTRNASRATCLLATCMNRTPQMFADGARGGESVACTRSERNPLGETLH